MSSLSLLFGLPEEPWRKDAICAQVGGDIWFPETGESPREAKKLCQQCPVQTECLTYALENHERFGIYGGLGPKERLKMQRGAA